MSDGNYYLGFRGNKGNIGKYVSSPKILGPKYLYRNPFGPNLSNYPLFEYLDPKGIWFRVSRE